MASLLRTDSYTDVSIFANFLVIVLGNSYNYCGIGFKTRKNITQKWVKKTLYRKHTKIPDFSFLKGR